MKHSLLGSLIVGSLAVAGACVAAGPDSAYPPGVISAGLQSTYDLKNTAGRNLKLTHSLPADIRLLPSARIHGDQVHIGASGSVSNFDFTGYGVYIDGPITFSCTSCKFANPAGDTYLVGVGTHLNTHGTAEVFNCTKCEFDGTNALTDNGGNFGAIRNYGAVTLSDFWMHDAPTNNILMVGTTLTLSRGYMQCPGKVGKGAPSTSLQHLDNIHIYSGTTTSANVFYDNYDGQAGGVQGGWTSPLGFAQGTKLGDVTVTYSQVIERGGASIFGSNGSPGASYTWQYNGAPGAEVYLTIDQSVLDTGNTGKYSSLPPPYVHFTDQNTNYNYSTGRRAKLPSGP
jgi:hypothetical protein